MFAGFASERLIVTFAHGLMTSVVALGFYGGKRKLLLGYSRAVGLHALINLGPVLFALKFIPAAISSLGSYTAILLAFFLFQREARTAKQMSGSLANEVIYFERR
jgi:uncharacterized membrane protein YhfC